MTDYTVTVTFDNEKETLGIRVDDETGFTRSYCLGDDPNELYLDEHDTLEECLASLREAYPEGVGTPTKA